MNRLLPRYARLALQDAVRNLRYARGDRRFLVVRDPVTPRYNLLLDWVALYLPELRPLFDLHQLPCHVRDWSRYVLHIPWLQDPVEQWWPWGFRQANRLAEQCDAHNVPVINRVDRLANAGKSTGARLMAETGIRTAKMALIENEDEFRDTRLGIPLPLFVRDDWVHGGPTLRADSDAEVRALPFEDFKRPVAVELIDVGNPDDGLYRKYRYVVCGDLGIPGALHVSTIWRTFGYSPEHGVFNEAILDEELEFANRPEPNHARFVAAREALGLDFVAFDYSFDPEGRLVVWEANPYPSLHFSGGSHSYRNAPTERVLAGMTKLYLERAGMDVPGGVDEAIDPAAGRRLRSGPIGA